MGLGWCCVHGLVNPCWWQNNPPPRQECRLLGPYERRDLGLSLRDWEGPPQCTLNLNPRHADPLRDPRSQLMMGPLPRNILRPRTNNLMVYVDVPQATPLVQVTPPSPPMPPLLLPPPPEFADPPIILSPKSYLSAYYKPINVPPVASNPVEMSGCKTPHCVSTERLLVQVSPPSSPMPPMPPMLLPPPPEFADPPIILSPNYKPINVPPVASDPVEMCGCKTPHCISTERIFVQVSPPSSPMPPMPPMLLQPPPEFADPPIILSPNYKPINVPPVASDPVEMCVCKTPHCISTESLFVQVTPPSSPMPPMLLPPPPEFADPPIILSPNYKPINVPPVASDPVEMCVCKTPHCISTESLFVQVTPPSSPMPPMLLPPPPEFADPPIILFPNYKPINVPPVASDPAEMCGCKTPHCGTKEILV